VKVIYTPTSNLKKTGSMAVGEVGFHKKKEVRLMRSNIAAMLTTRRLKKVGTFMKVFLYRLSISYAAVLVPKRENSIINRLNKTKLVRSVDHEAERTKRQMEQALAQKDAVRSKVRS
jgi:hypothetical protein